MKPVNYRPNPAQDTPEECRQAGWMELSDFENFIKSDWLDMRTTSEKLLVIAEKGAELREPTFIPELGVVAISACTNPERKWMILPVASFNSGSVIAE